MNVLRSLDNYLPQVSLLAPLRRTQRESVVGGYIWPNLVMALSACVYREFLFVILFVMCVSPFLLYIQLYLQNYASFTALLSLGAYLLQETRATAYTFSTVHNLRKT